MAFLARKDRTETHGHTLESWTPLSDHLMRVEWLIANITAVGFPIRQPSEQKVQFCWLFLTCLVILDHFCGHGATLRSWNQLLSPKNLIYGHLMKMNRLITKVTADASPVRAETGDFWIFWRLLTKSGHFGGRAESEDFGCFLSFWPIWVAFVIWETLCDL